MGRGQRFTSPFQSACQSHDPRHRTSREGDAGNTLPACDSTRPTLPTLCFCTNASLLSHNSFCEVCFSKCTVLCRGEHSQSQAAITVQLDSIVTKGSCTPMSSHASSSQHPPTCFPWLWVRLSQMFPPNGVARARAPPPAALKFQRHSKPCFCPARCS